MNPLTPEQLAVWLPAMNGASDAQVAVELAARNLKSAQENRDAVIAKSFGGVSPEYVKGQWVTGS